jgi:WD40 repeat protein
VPLDLSALLDLDPLEAARLADDLTLGGSWLAACIADASEGGTSLRRVVAPGSSLIHELMPDRPDRQRLMLVQAAVVESARLWRAGAGNDALDLYARARRGWAAGRTIRSDDFDWRGSRLATLSDSVSAARGDPDGEWIWAPVEDLLLRVSGERSVGPSISVRFLTAGPGRALAIYSIVVEHVPGGSPGCWIDLDRFGFTTIDGHLTRAIGRSWSWARQRPERWPSLRWRVVNEDGRTPSGVLGSSIGGAAALAFASGLGRVTSPIDPNVIIAAGASGDGTLVPLEGWPPARSGYPPVKVVVSDRGDADRCRAALPASSPSVARTVAEAAERAQRTRPLLPIAALLVAGGIGLCAALIALAYTVRSADRRAAERDRVDRASALAEAAETRLDADPAEAMLLAAAAYEMDPEVPSARQALLHAVNVDSDVQALLRGHEGSVRGLVLDRDADRLVSAGDDGRVLSWRLGDADIGPVALVAGGPSIERLVADDGGERVASADREGLVRVWRTESEGSAPLEMDLGGAPAALTISADGRRLAASSSTTVSIWDLEEWSRIPADTFDAPGAVSALAFSPDGMLSVGTVDGDVVHLHGSAAGATTNVADAVRAITWSPTGGWLYVAAGEELHVVDSAAMPLRSPVSIPADAVPVIRPAASTAGMFDGTVDRVPGAVSVAVSAVNAALIVPDAPDDLTAAADSDRIGGGEVQPQSGSNLLAYSADGLTTATASSSGTIRVGATQSPLPEIFDLADVHSVPGEDGAVFVTGKLTSQATVGWLDWMEWDARPQERLAQGRALTLGSRSALADDGHVLATLGADEGSIAFWEVEGSSLEEAESIEVFEGRPVTALAFDADGRLVVASGEQLAVVDVDDLNEPHLRDTTTVADPVSCIDRGSAGALLVCTRDGLFRVGRGPDGDFSDTDPDLVFDQEVSIMARSASGEVATGAYDGRVDLFPGGLGADPPAEALRRHDQPILAMSFSGDVLATLSLYNPLVLWDRSTGDHIADVPLRGGVTVWDLGDGRLGYADLDDELHVLTTDADRAASVVCGTVRSSPQIWSDVDDPRATGMANPCSQRAMVDS